MTEIYIEDYLNSLNLDGVINTAAFATWILGFAIIFFIIIIIASIITVASGLLTGYGLYVMATRQGIENPWLAFIPFGQSYILGAVVGELVLFNTKLDTKLVLPLSRGAVMVVSSMSIFIAPVLGFLISIASVAVQVYYFYVLYKLFVTRKPESAVIYTVLSVLFTVIALPIIMLMIKDKDPIVPDVIYDEPLL